MTIPFRTALVTGGAGFIGHHIARTLLARGCNVRVLDDLSRGSRTRLTEIGAGVDFVEGSILDDNALEKSVRGVDVIFHHGAWASVPQSVEQPIEYQEIDATGTLKVLEAARKLGVRRIVYAASSSAYGDQPELPKREDQIPTPISPYAVAKYVGELYLSVYAKLHGMETISLRYFNVFGPHQDPKSLYGAAIPAIVSRVVKGISPTIYGDGEQTRDFCYIDNVVEANLLAASATGVAGQVVNVACGQRVSVNDIVRLANQFLGTNVKPTYAPPRVGDVKDSWADCSLAAKVIGYKPKVFFEEGLKRWIDWYKTSEYMRS
ncbi:MAG TPA: SDR family oxidoreductase [Tepidisphaeraceae bacterium]|nr:SDR family oxidoreductase [Tepidisphaeraceae bacterium]